MCDYENEEWRPVVGWEKFYEVNERGLVRSPERVVMRRDGIAVNYKSRMLTIYQDGDGYAFVRLYRHRTEETRRRIHELVADAFGIDPDEVLRTHGTWLFNDSGDVGILSVNIEPVDENEEWRDIEGYDYRYQASSYGHIRKVTTSASGHEINTVLKQVPSKQSGRFRVVLTKDGRRRYAFVDILVATLFMHRPYGCSFVRHLNGDLSDLRVDNLEWATSLVEHDAVEFDEEVWRPVPGWEDLYDVSSKGSLRSHDRYVTGRDGKTFFRPGTLMSLKPDDKGYVRVALTRDGSITYESAHRIVAMAFLDNPDNLPFVDHINGIRNDNRVENLRWATQLDNMRNSSQIRDVIVNDYIEPNVGESYTGEEWRDMEGYDGYQASSCGRIRSLPRRIRSSKGMRNIPGKIISMRPIESGRMMVCLNRPKKCNVFVDEAVARAFVPNDESKEFVIHLNGDNADSNADNLAWASLDEIASAHCDDDPAYDSGEWADVAGYDNRFRVSREGVVRARSRIVRCAGYRVVEGRELEVFDGDDGQKSVLFDVGLGDRVEVRVSDIVDASFKAVANESEFEAYVNDFVSGISRDREEWREVTNVQPGYLVSNYGRVLKLPTLVTSDGTQRIVVGGLLRQYHNELGYAYTGLQDGDSSKTITVHRIVATAFHENPLGLPTINHLDENPSNNCEWNLRWCSQDENNKYGHHMENAVKNHDYTASAFKLRKPILQFDENDNLVRCWSGACEISDVLGFSTSRISNACHRNKRCPDGVAFGYKWYFKEDYPCAG